MLSDLEMRKKLFMNDGAIANKLKLNADGSVTLGRTSCDLWNRLTGDRKEVSVNDLCLKIIDEISGKGQVRNRDAFRALNLDFIRNALEERNYDIAIARLFLAYRMEYVGDLSQTEEYQDNRPSQSRPEREVICYQQNNTPKQEYIAVCADPFGSISLHKIKSFKP